MSKERFKRSKNCPQKLACMLAGRCLDSLFLEVDYARRAGRLQSSSSEDFDSDKNCDHPDAERFRLKIKLSKNQKMVHPSRRMR